MKRIAFILAALAICAANPAAAASSPWQKTEGGAVRLVTAGPPDAQGALRGVLQIRLKPGWKTYWRDPGGSGVPPQIDASASANVKSSRMMFPAPERIDDGNAQTAGYHRSVSLPVVFTLDDAHAKTTIDADVFLGICKEICIPVQAHFTIDAAAQADDGRDGSIVDQGFAALPADPTDDFQVSALEMKGDMLSANADVPQEAGEPQLFIASADGYLLGLAELRGSGNGSASFAARIFQKPNDEKSARFHYTLIAGGHAVSGVAELR